MTKKYFSQPVSRLNQEKEYQTSIPSLREKSIHSIKKEGENPRTNQARQKSTPAEKADMDRTKRQDSEFQFGKINIRRSVRRLRKSENPHEIGVLRIVSQANPPFRIFDQSRIRTVAFKVLNQAVVAALMLADAPQPLSAPLSCFLFRSRRRHTAALLMPRKNVHLCLCIKLPDKSAQVVQARTFRRSNIVTGTGDSQL